MALAQQQNAVADAQAQVHLANQRVQVGPKHSYYQGTTSLNTSISLVSLFPLTFLTPPSLA